MCHEINDGAVIPFDKDFGGLIACVVFSCEYNSVRSTACLGMRSVRTGIDRDTEGVNRFQGSVGVPP